MNSTATNQATLTMSTNRAAQSKSVYVVELDPSVWIESKAFREENPQYAPASGAKCLYVGMTGHAPAERFAKHKAGIKAGRGFVRRYGLALRPDLFEHENPLTYDAACQREVSLAEELRARGHAVRQN